MLNNRLAEADAPEQFIPTDYHGEVLDRFLLILSNDKLSRQSKMEALWGLSNFATETGVADKLAAYDELLDVVVDYAIATSGFLRVNAIWVLANMVAKAVSEETRLALSYHDGVWTALTEAISDNLKNAPAAEAIAKLTAWKEEFALEDDEEDDDEAILDEIEKDMEEVTANLPVELDYPFPPVPNVQVEDRVPTALDLILAGSAKPSTVVRNLISSLQEVGYTQWVVVPADTQLTIADLTTLQAMGYSLCHGYFSVSRPLLESIYA
jgi:hypothetical protein